MVRGRLDELSKDIQRAQTLEIHIMPGLRANLRVGGDRPFEQVERPFRVVSPRVDRREQIERQVLLGGVAQHRLRQTFRKGFVAVVQGCGCGRQALFDRAWSGRASAELPLAQGQVHPASVAERPFGREIREEGAEALGRIAVGVLLERVHALLE